MSKNASKPWKTQVRLGQQVRKSKFIKIRVIRAHAYNGATIAKEHKVDVIGLYT